MFAVLTATKHEADHLTQLSSSFFLHCDKQL